MTHTPAFLFGQNTSGEPLAAGAAPQTPLSIGADTWM
jgi:hypothetical protein